MRTALLKASLTVVLILTIVGVSILGVTTSKDSVETYDETANGLPLIIETTVKPTETTNKTREIEIITDPPETKKPTEVTTEQPTTTHPKEATKPNETTKIVEPTEPIESPENEAIYSASTFQNMGVINWNGWRWTWYSERVLPGDGLDIPGRHADSNGYICDEDNYICLSSSVLSKGTVISTPFGKSGKVYDCGCANDTVDVYVNW